MWLYSGFGARDSSGAMRWAPSLLGLALAVVTHDARSAGPTALVPLPADAVQRLRSGNPDAIGGALDDVRVSGRAAAPAVPVVCAILKLGLPPALTVSAIQALGDTESPAASDALEWYARHRSPDVRRAAVTALAKTGGRTAPRVLREALSDSDAGVRGIAASALGALKATDAVPELFVALDHDVAEASASIGQLCAGEACERLASELGRIPFDIVTSGLSEILFRPSTEIDDALKVKLVERLRDVGTAEAHRFLKDVQGKWPARSSFKVKQAIDEAVDATVSSPGGTGPEGAP